MTKSKLTLLYTYFLCVLSDHCPKKNTNVEYPVHNLEKMFIIFFAEMDTEKPDSISTIF